MHTVEPEYLSELVLQRFSANGDGMHVEAIGRPSAALIPFMTFRADELLGKVCTTGPAARFNAVCELEAG